MGQHISRRHDGRPERDTGSEGELHGLWTRDAMKNMNQKFIEQVQRALQQELQDKAAAEADG